jgi:hypothetical protein
VVLQTLVPQVNPPSQVCGAGGVPQAPALQAAAATKELPAQLVPQDRAPWGAPLATALHLPSALATSHAWQAPVHAPSQQ